MIIRSMTPEDINYFEELSRKLYPEFHSPEFHDNFFSRFVIESKDGYPIIGCGIRQIAEVILVTDKTQNVHTIGEALIKTLGHCIYSAKMRNIDFLYAFVQDPNYKKHLIQHGFTSIQGQPLSLWVKGLKSGE